MLTNATHDPTAARPGGNQVECAAHARFHMPVPQPARQLLACGECLPDLVGCGAQRPLYEHRFAGHAAPPRLALRALPAAAAPDLRLACIHALLPERAATFEPALNLAKSFRVEVIEPAPAVLTHTNQSGVEQSSKLPGDRRAAHGELRRELTSAALAFGEQVEQPSAIGMGEGFEDVHADSVSCSLRKESLTLLLEAPASLQHPPLPAARTSPSKPPTRDGPFLPRGPRSAPAGPLGVLGLVPRRRLT